MQTRRDMNEYRELLTTVTHGIEKILGNAEFWDNWAKGQDVTLI